MKKHILSFLALGLFMAGVAQSTVSDAPKDERQAERARIMTERMALKLELKAEQKAALERIHLLEIEEKASLRAESRANVAAKRAEMIDKREALKEQRDAVVAEREQIQAQKEAMQAEKEAIDEKYRAQVKSVLTETQFENYLLIKGRQEAQKNKALRKRKMLKPMPEAVSKEE